MLLLAFVIYSSSLFPPYLFPSTLDVSCYVALSGAAIVLVATRRKLHYGCLRLVFCDLLAFCRSLARVLEDYRNPVTAVSVCLSVCLSVSTSLHLVDPLLDGLAVVLDDLKYAESHEWVKLEGDYAVVGITHHAQVCTSVFP